MLPQPSEPGGLLRTARTRPPPAGAGRSRNRVAAAHRVKKLPGQPGSRSPPRLQLCDRSVLPLGLSGTLVPLCPPSPTPDECLTHGLASRTVWLCSFQSAVWGTLGQGVDSGTDLLRAHTGRGPGDRVRSNLPPSAVVLPKCWGLRDLVLLPAAWTQCPHVPRRQGRAAQRGRVRLAYRFHLLGLSCTVMKITEPHWKPGRFTRSCGVRSVYVVAQVGYVWYHRCL